MHQHHVMNGLNSSFLSAIGLPPTAMAPHHIQQSLAELESAGFIPEGFKLAGNGSEIDRTPNYYPISPSQSSVSTFPDGLPSAHRDWHGD